MAYGERKNDRLQVSVVAYDDGGSSEVFWSRSRDIITMDHEGSVLLGTDGSLHMRLNRDDDEPFTLSVYGNRIVVRHTEDLSLSPAEGQAEIVFDSNALKLDEEEGQ